MTKLVNIADALRDYEQRERERTDRRVPSRINSDDIRHIMRQLDLATDLYLSAIDGYMERYNRSCSVTATIDTRDFLNGLRDLLADELTGRLMQRADELDGN